jgi:hypothetical protein
MRTLVLSVCVGLLASACTGSVDGASVEVEDDEAGADRGDAGQFDPGADSGSQTRRDAATGAPADGAVARDANGSDVASDSGVRDASGGSVDASAGKPDSGSSLPDAGGGGTGRPVFVAAGYSHGIAFSRDLGLTWTTVQGPNGPAADNEYVLSGAAFTNGTFVVAGFDIFSSTDGERWPQRTNPTDQWLGNVSVGLGLFVGVGGYGTALWSEDGVTWRKGTMLGTDGFDTSAFGNGMFRATSKGGQWWNSADGKNWTRMDGESGHTSKIVWCADHFADERDCQPLVTTGQTAFGENVWIRAQHNSQLRRSTNGGQSWTDVSVNFDANCVAFGYVQ